MQYHMDSHEGTYKRSFESEVTAVFPGIVELEETAFYHLGGGQPPDNGKLIWDEGESFVHDVRKKNRIRHMIEGDLPEVGYQIKGNINWDRRYNHMKMHTALHILCSVVPMDVTGGQIGLEKSRLDFNADAESINKQDIQEKINDILKDNHKILYEWITNEELDKNPELVRTMSVKPPKTEGKIRLVKIGEIDLQPCGGTHVKETKEIGSITIGKIENKGKMNRRINININD